MGLEMVAWKGFQHGSCMIFHVDGDLARECAVQLHAKAIMHLSPCGFDFANGSIHVNNPLEKLIHDLAVSMDCLWVVHVPKQGQLLEICHLVGNAWVTWIDCESTFD